MTDTAFYDRMNNLATRLLNKFGALATLRDVTTGKTKADANGVISLTGPTDTPGLAVRVTSEQVLNMMNAEVEQTYVFKCPKVATTDMKLIFAGKTYAIKDVKEITPDGQTLIVMFLGVAAA